MDSGATDAAEVLYRRLCSGDVATEAVACARRELDRDDQGRPVPAHAWSTLELLATKLPGFAIDPDETPVRDLAPTSSSLSRILGNRIRVLDKGFVGRRRELQALGNILRHGRWAPAGEAERAVAGALVVGMKGQGKSCLVGRALDRHQQDSAPKRKAPAGSYVQLRGKPYDSQRAGSYDPARRVPGRDLLGRDLLGRDLRCSICGPLRYWSARAVPSTSPLPRRMLSGTTGRLAR